MPETRKQKLIYAFITILITVPCFVTYCLSIENRGILNISITNILILIPIEFILAYISEVFLVEPLVCKLAFKVVNFKKNSETLVQTVIICTTVCLMCPWMSFLATILYKGIFPGVIYKATNWTLSNFFVYLIPNFLQTVVLNFPFALFSQLFFIQPLVRKTFKLIYKK